MNPDKPNPIEDLEHYGPALGPDLGGSEPHMQLPKIISFDSLARCGEEIWIENKGQVYRLRRTRQGKLILTK